MLMAEYVTKEALYKLGYWHGEHPDAGHPYGDGRDAVDTSDIEDMPCDDVKPVKHGYWKGTFFNVQCSECGYVYSNLGQTQYCPHCGTRMDGDEYDE